MSYENSLNLEQPDLQFLEKVLILKQSIVKVWTEAFPAVYLARVDLQRVER